MKIPKSPSIPKGYDWTIEFHDNVTSFDPSKLSFHLEPEQEKRYINGEILSERMKGKGLNANVLEYLLKHPKLIPEDWKGKFIYFWGTIYRRSGGYLLIRCLCWRGGAWRWGSHWLDGDWYSSSPAAVSSSGSQDSVSMSSGLGHSALCPHCKKSIILS